MSDIPEAIGTASEGGLFARAISRESGGSSTDADGHFAETACLNCGTELVGPHCHTCGQAAHLHRTLSAVGHDLVHGVLHLDGKLWRTLPLLAWRPGDLTRRYIAGERADFVSPMAMFLFTVFLMFAVFQAVGFTTPTDIAVPDMKQIGSVLEKEQADLKGKRADLLTRLEATKDEAEASKIRSAIDKVDQDIASIETGRSAIEGDKDGKSNLNITIGNPAGSEFLEHLNEKWRKNPGLMLYKLQSNSYKFSWLLIPLSLPFVWLLFAWRREFKAYDHAVFVTYSLSFMSLMFIALSLLAKAGVGLGWLFTIFATIAPLHIYRQLKQGYALSRWSAIWRLLVLLFAIFIVLSLFLQTLLLLGAF
ncbi:DUF3667 domain-containing protein [Alteriqipengyuania sp. NZ-12B]|uniref:DUF3667 domain-containing protein n=1 Tax=Alteriqipengyuania abyssalis TaxID=2860200 RepID=A0ABS7PBV6_9SPHN|nr:DUF3667 domain-containing protein [Alteriqipengyuania abyssalis]MBY8336538.1 DUF3667 domain-containing protein [Alteriqipengyuania abyssalis]